MLIRPGQQFWRIFQVKYVSNESSNQYGNNVVSDWFSELFPLVTLNFMKLSKNIFKNLLLSGNAFV